MSTLDQNLMHGFLTMNFNKKEIAHLYSIGNKAVKEYIDFKKNRPSPIGQLNKITTAPNNHIEVKAKKNRIVLIAGRTEPEKIFLELLKSKNINFEFQKIFYIDRKSKFSKEIRMINCYYLISDFYLPEYKIVTEIDGSYHSKYNDSKRDRYLKHYGIKTIRFLNSDLDNFEKCDRKMKMALTSI